MGTVTPIRPDVPIQNQTPLGAIANIATQDQTQAPYCYVDLEHAGAVVSYDTANDLGQLIAALIVAQGTCFREATRIVGSEAVVQRLIATALPQPESSAKPTPESQPEAPRGSSGPTAG